MVVEVLGKTTMILQLLQASPLETSKKLYISCDHASLQGVSLFDFVDEFSKRGGGFHSFLGENIVDNNFDFLLYLFMVVNINYDIIFMDITIKR